MQPEVTLAVLTELGVLFKAPHAEFEEPQPDDAPAEQEHAFLTHTPLWEYEAKGFAQPYADEDATLLFQTLPPGTSMEQALAHTRLIVFLGAAPTQAFRRALAEPRALLLIFDNSPQRVAELALAVGVQKLAGRAHIFLGPVERFVPPLGMVLPSNIFDAGFPVFFSLWPERDSIDAGLRLDNPARLLETLHYRYKLYPLSGQANGRGLPLRPIQRGLFYDQQLHAYQNVVDFFALPDISPLRRFFQGETAILVAAGPDLPEHAEFLRAMRPKAVIIAVNNALKPLLALGVRPHIVVANDTSVATAKSWEGLPRLDDITLVSHCLADLGREVFATTFLFGAYQPELFGQRPSLRLHGSVITTAFSLARHLGVARCILLGVQLSSADPWQLTYSKNSIHGSAPKPPQKPLTHAHPQLVPVRNAQGLLRYTTLNFLDASLWFLEEIRSSDVPCVNLTDASLVLGPGVELDPAPEVAATGRLERRLRQIPLLRTAPRPVLAALKAMRAQREFWASVAQACARLGAEQGPAFLPQALALLERFDQSNVSYLVQRFEDFDNRSFYRSVFFFTDDARRQDGLRYYHDYVERMARGFAELLEVGMARLEAFDAARRTGR
ncbi:6-hydroxymethylpterin diphosphokinase MptE-like protein [Humidesulfovibrio sp.]